nr:hypothetical protein [Tanacetum cinerariifolium]
MNITKEQQQALDDALVPREQRLKIRNCNYRLSTTFKPKESTFQIALDVLSLTSFYQAFLISENVPAIYMHEFWATVSFHKQCIKFKLNIKNHSFDLETFRDMLQICPNVPGQKFVDPLFEEEILAFIRKLEHLEPSSTNVSVVKYLDLINFVSLGFKSFGMMRKNEKEKTGDDEVSSDHRVYTPPDHQLTDEDENQEGDDEVKELQQQSYSVSSELVSKFINPSLDTGIDSILSLNIQSETLVNIPVSIAAETPSSDTAIPQPQSELSEFRQTNQFAEAISLIMGIVDNYLASKMKEIVDVESTIKIIIKEQVQAQVSKIMPKIEKEVEMIKIRMKTPFTRSNRGSKRRRSGKKAKSSKEPTHKESKSTSSSKDASRYQPQSTGKFAHNERGRQVIPWDYFINNVLKYLKGVESYQKKINLKRAYTYRSDPKRMTPYTMYPDIQGIIYEDTMNRNRLMRTDELHKFSDGTLNHVRIDLNDIATGIEMDYLPKQK